jgi:hypothetical protein
MYTVYRDTDTVWGDGEVQIRVQAAELSKCCSMLNQCALPHVCVAEPDRVPAGVPHVDLVHSCAHDRGVTCIVVVRRQGGVSRCGLCPAVSTTGGLPFTRPPPPAAEWLSSILTAEEQISRACAKESSPWVLSFSFAAFTPASLRSELPLSSFVGTTLPSLTGP